MQEFKNQPQGLVTGICAWTRFKRNDTEFAYESNFNPTIEEYDRIKVKIYILFFNKISRIYLWTNKNHVPFKYHQVKQLREWIKSNPEVYALKELNLNRVALVADANNIPTEEQLNLAASAMNLQPTSSSSSSIPHTYATTLASTIKPITFSQIKTDSYFDIICQVCIPFYSCIKIATTSKPIQM